MPEDKLRQSVPAGCIVRRLTTKTASFLGTVPLLHSPRGIDPRRTPPPVQLHHLADSAPADREPTY